MTRLQDPTWVSGFATRHNHEALSWYDLSATCHSKDNDPSQGLYLFWIILRHRCIRTELITLNLICPSTYQLLRSFGGISGPYMSFNKSTSLERSFSLARAALAEVSKLIFLLQTSEGDYTSSYPLVNDLPTDGYDRNDVEQLCAHLFCLCEMREKVTKEPHHLSFPLLERVSSHTTALATEGAMILLPTLDGIAASFLDPRVTKKSKGPSQARVHSALVTAPEPELGQAEGVDEADLINFYAKIENNLERDEGTSARATSTLTSRLGKRLGAFPFVADVSTSEPSYGGILVHPFTFGRGLSLKGAIVSGYTRKSEDEVLRRQVDPLDSLARSALARDMSYLYEGASSHPYTKEEWNGRHAPEGNLLCKDIFKDTDVCRKALDRTITPAKLKKTESLLSLDLENHFNVLSTLLVSHGAQLNSRYTGSSFESYKFNGKLKRIQKNYDALVQENGVLRSQKDDAFVKLKEMQTKLTDARNQLALEKGKSQRYKDAIDGLRDEVTQFIGSGVRSLVRKELHMGHTDVEFEAAVQKVSNFHVGAKADFDKALVDFPTTSFPFLNKIDAAYRGTLFEVTQVLPDKNIRLVIPAYVVPSIVNEDVDHVLLEHASDA
uniref:Uncharacterized protein n=1 Tax=Tanacetum cinerariifolium TaxID=118510 RepID=A0A6L2N486_TANCI|nr:hypothetical protein [Tanacetum cinerariifolium]